MRSYMQKKYTKYITDKLFDHIDLQKEFTFDEFCKAFDKVEKQSSIFAFSIYDYDNDGCITLHDLFDILKNNEK